MASAKSWGIDAARLVTPAEIKELVPFINESILLGGFYTPSVSVVDSLRAGTLMRDAGRRRGRAARSSPTPRCSAIEVEHGRVRRVAHRHAGTYRGRVRRDRVRRVEPAARRDGRRAHPARRPRCTR